MWVFQTHVKFNVSSYTLKNGVKPNSTFLCCKVFDGIHSTRPTISRRARHKTGISPSRHRWDGGARHDEKVPLYQPHERPHQHLCKPRGPLPEGCAYPSARTKMPCASKSFWIERPFVKAIALRRESTLPAP